MFNIFGKKKKAKEETPCDEFTSPSTSPTAGNPTASKPKKKSSTIPDFLQFDDIDESQLHVTEEDMQDPEMLAMLDSLNSHVPRASAAKSKSHTNSDVYFDIDDSSVSFLDGDMNDPALNAELAALPSPPAVAKDSMEDLIDIFDGPASSPAVPAALPKKAPSSLVPLDDATRIHVLKLRRQALNYKNVGNIAKATELLREAKSIEVGAKSVTTAISIASQKTSDKPFKKPMPPSQSAPSALTTQAPSLSASTTATTPTSHMTADAFLPIISTLQTEIQQCINEAESMRLSDPKKARQFLDMCATYRLELAMMESRRHIPGALPPAIRWDVTRKEVNYEDSTLTDTQVRIRIDRVVGIEAMLKNVGGNMVFVTMDITGVKEQSQSTTKTVKYANGSAEFDFERVFDVRKAAMKNIHIKKANLTLFVKGGLFSGDVELGTVKFPLTALSSTCETGGSFPLVGSKASGSICAMVHIRKPSITPEKREITDRKLIVVWPEEPETDASSRMSESRLMQMDMRPTSTPRRSEEAAAAKPSPSTANERFQILTTAEKKDPLNLQYLISFQVLSAESDELARAIQACKNEDEMIQLTTRKATVDGNLVQGTLQIQREEISPVEYLAQVRERLKRDEVLGVYCLNEGRKAEALKVMRRIKIMKGEICDMEKEMASMGIEDTEAAPSTTPPPYTEEPVSLEPRPCFAECDSSPAAAPISVQPAVTVQSNRARSMSPAAPVTTKTSVCLTNYEKEQPFALELLVSVRVLESESEELKKQIADGNGDAAALSNRKSEIDTKLNKLNISFQCKEMSSVDYLQTVRERLRHDQALAVHCLKEGRKAEAVKVMRRVKIMQSEISEMEKEMENGNIELFAKTMPSPAAASSPPQPSSPKKVDVSEFSPEELADPLAVQYMESDEVMKAEIGRIEAQLEQLPDGDPMFVSLSARRELIEKKMFELFMAAQGKMTLSMYCKKLDDKVKAAKRIAVYCFENNRKPEAVEIMKRSKIMESEVSSIKNGMSMFADSFTRK